MIQRYSIGINIEKCDGADFVLYTDHLAEIEQLKQENAKLKEAIEYTTLTVDKYAERMKNITKERDGLKEYSESRDESIKVYREENARISNEAVEIIHNLKADNILLREEIKELKERLKGLLTTSIDE